MLNKASIAVVSRTFSNTPELVTELKKHFSNVKFNVDQKLSKDELIDFIGSAEAALVALEVMDSYVIESCTNLKIIAKYGVGLDNIDIGTCKARGISIGWTGGTNRLAVAEMTLGFMLSLSRNLFTTSYQLKRGIWNKDGGFQLSNRIIGIIGVGNVGKEVIRLLKPFNCRILVNDIINQKDYYMAESVEEVSKEEIFAKADIITLHVPLTGLTKNIVNSISLGLMRPDACIINTARGGLIDHTALKIALKSKKIAGAAIDVYDEEPPMDTTLLSFDNLIGTPHIGGNSKEAVLAMGRSAIEHLKVCFSV